MQKIKNNKFKSFTYILEVLAMTAALLNLFQLSLSLSLNMLAANMYV